MSTTSPNTTTPISTTSVPTIDNDLATLVNAELDRVNLKKENVDVAIQGKNRASFLNENYRERFSIYVNLVIIILVALVFLFISFSLSNYYPASSFIFNIISFIVIGVALLFSYYNVQTLYLRDNIYFDELRLAPPDAKGNVSYTVDSSNIFLPDLYMGAQYCDNAQNVFYDKSSGLCEDKANIKPEDVVSASDYMKWTNGSMYSNEDYANQGGGVEDPQFGADNPMNTIPTPTPTSTSIKQSFTTMDLANQNGIANPFDNNEFSKYEMYK